MRRSFSLVQLGSILFAFALLGALWGAMSPALGGTPTPGDEIECPDSTVPDDFAFAVLGAVEVPGTQELQSVLARVDLQPDAAMFPSHCHSGAFVLWVDWGAICFRQDATNGATVTATAPVTEDTGTCGGTVTDCSAGCDLQDGDTVYLPAGSVVTQTATAFHSYGNADEELPAVVYSTQTLPAVGSGPSCGGSCPTP